MALHAFVVTRESDLEALFRLRYRVFTQEQDKYTAIADHAGGRLVDDLDARATHLAVAQDGRIVGGLRQLRGRRLATPAMVDRLGLDRLAHRPDAEFGFSGRLCVEPEHRGSRALLELLSLNHRTAVAQGGRFDFIFCNPHIVTQYEALGYRRYHRGYVDPQLGWQAPMVLDVRDLDHLQACKSPFASMLSAAGAAPPDPVLQSMWIGRTRLEHGAAHALAQRALGAKGDDPALAGLLAEWLLEAPLLAAGDGMTLTPLGTPGRELFVLAEGRVLLTPPDGPSTRLDPGGVFGLDALLARAAHQTEARSSGAVKVVAVSDRQVEQALRRQGPLARRTLQGLQSAASAGAGRAPRAPWATTSLEALKPANLVT